MESRLFTRIKWAIVIMLFMLFSNYIDAQPSTGKSLAELHEQLIQADSGYFSSIFGRCDIDKASSYLAGDFEFFQETRGSLTLKQTGRAEFIENLRKNFCGTAALKMRRELVKGSVQTTALEKFGALQTGIQRFYLSAGTEGEKLVETTRFSRVWKINNGKWQVIKETDFHQSDEGVSASAQKTYVPDDKNLYNEIVKMDSILFDAYDNCKLEVSRALYSDSIEFYHDKGGVMTSKPLLIEALKNNICGKVTRHLVKGSIEVYPIGDWGAVEMGSHTFHNKLEPDAPSTVGKFVLLWQKIAGKWYVSRVISLH
ncbi:MAG: nuclear transport factor 2 family protein [Chitinophagaceae bacterium]|nr:nuclear transport factor 2 family protein [Chitinophagaceae bacterium]